jgi:hypothetical protein
MAKEVQRTKAKETIIKLFVQKNLANDRIAILNVLIQSMIDPTNKDDNGKVGKLQKELNLYKKLGGSALNERVKDDLQKEKEEAKKEPAKEK